VDISHSWGQYSPFFSVPSEIDPVVPPGCTIVTAQMVSRHGARFPTKNKSDIYNKTIKRIQQSVTEYGPGFEFIKDYSYNLGAEDLTLFGERQMVHSGVKFYARYRTLASQITPFLRVSGSDRVIASAQNWTQGFHGAKIQDTQSESEDFPFAMLIIPEETGFNNSIDHGTCPAFEGSKTGDAAQATFLAAFAPSLTARLNKGLPGANLTNTDTISIMDLCPYNTVATTDGRLSEFCELFTLSDWHNYDYYQSLGKWYGYGRGNALGATQGVGFVNELIARMTGKPVSDHTSINVTLDSDPATFPLDAKLYADFTHDNSMESMFAALGLYIGTANLSNSTAAPPAQAGGFSSSWTVPFAARAYVEKMACESGSGPKGTKEELIRVLVNDRVVPLQSCGADVFGRCTMDKWVESLSFARSGGLWDACFV